MGTVYDKLVDQAEAMVNIINKKYDDIASSVFNLVHNTERIIKK